MKFKTNFKDMREAVVTIGKAVKKNMSPIEISLVKIEAGEDYVELSTNGSIGACVKIQAVVEEAGSFVTSFSGINILSVRKCDGDINASNEVNEKYNFNKAIFPGIQGGPLMHVIAGKAVAFKEALDPSFKEYMTQVVKNADTLANALIEEGFDIVSGGTDNHLMLVDLKKYGLTGKEAEKVLDSVHITCNKNTVPNDPKSPFVTSGLRLGTPAVTTRGLKEDDMKVIAKAIRLTLLDKKLDEANELVLGLTKKYPIYE